MRRPTGPPPDAPVLPDQPDWSAVFGRPAPLHLEIGSGHGGFALGFAAAHPEVDFVAIEWRKKFAEITWARAVARGLANLVVVGADARTEAPRLFGPASLAAIHLHFPDPWWKRRHFKRRVIDEGFAHLLFALLVPGGLLDVRTDVEDRARDMETLLDAAGFANEAGPGGFSARPEGEIPSSREKRYLAAGEPVWRLRLFRPR